MEQIIQLHDKQFKPFIDSSKIQDAILALAQKINTTYEGKNPVFIGVLNGSFLFTADLVRHFNGDCEVSFMKMASYEGTSTTGIVNELIGLNLDIKDREVIILEDIVDTGNTLEKLFHELKKKQPKSLAIATLLFKPKAYQKDIPVDYVAMEVGNEFLVGYGLDYDGLGRNLKDIYIIC
ncbi:hypoxanthine phosphoribosyltransferase [Parvicella tangerina]|uniref:Hypoxanthine phosphoribosyltransferase n=1 Tax=Parvicella tangerina TaxID=2829795 RepID=A0A916JLT9_9FLAO|nr:hypoxanthine phosphoribosyltransferase [Parvicella tangerina]CAG5081601.1 Hypoxanthine phosphoribosyltransferase [Parvicella tangerina]